MVSKSAIELVIVVILVAVLTPLLPAQNSEPDSIADWTPRKLADLREYRSVRVIPR